MLLSVIASIVIIASYTAILCIKEHGVPYSISETYYRLRHPYIFLATMWSTALALLIPALDVSKGESGAAIMIAAFGMFLVGAAPHFKSDDQRYVHIVGAALSLIASQVWVGMNCPLLLLMWLLWFLYVIAHMYIVISDSIVSDFIRSRPLFWAEICALLATFATIFVNLFK